MHQENGYHAGKRSPFVTISFYTLPPVFFAVLATLNPKGVRTFTVAEYRCVLFAPSPSCHFRSLPLLAQVSPITRLLWPYSSILTRQRNIQSSLHFRTTPTLKDHGRRFTLSRFSFTLFLSLSEPNALI